MSKNKKKYLKAFLKALKEKEKWLLRCLIWSTSNLMQPSSLPVCTFWQTIYRNPKKLLSSISLIVSKSTSNLIHPPFEERMSAFITLLNYNPTSFACGQNTMDGWEKGGVVWFDIY